MYGGFGLWAVVVKANLILMIGSYERKPHHSKYTGARKASLLFSLAELEVRIGIFQERALQIQTNARTLPAQSLGALIRLCLRLDGDLDWCGADVGHLCHTSVSQPRGEQQRI